MRTQGSKTFQYLVEKKPIGISLVAASENEEAQTGIIYFCSNVEVRNGGVVRSAIIFIDRKVTNCFVRRIIWKDEPQQVIALYPKTKQLLC